MLYGDLNLEQFDLPPARLVPFPTGQLETTRDPLHVDENSLTVCHNAQRENGSLELTPRYRQFNPTPPQGAIAGAANQKTFPMALLINRFGSVEKYTNIYNQELREMDATQITGDGVASDWSAALVNALDNAPGNDWQIWEYGDRIYFCNAAAGLLYKTIGGAFNSLTPIANSPAKPQIKVNRYQNLFAFAGGANPTITLVDTGAAGFAVAQNVDNMELSTAVAATGDLAITLDWGAGNVFNTNYATQYHKYAFFKIESLDANAKIRMLAPGRPINVEVGIIPIDGTCETVEYDYVYNPNDNSFGNGLYIRLKFSQDLATLWNTNSVSGMRITFKYQTLAVAGAKFRITPLLLAGNDLFDAGDQIAGKVSFATAYYNMGGSIPPAPIQHSRLSAITELLAVNAAGHNPYAERAPTLPPGGTSVWIEIPWDATAGIRFYMQAKGEWYRITSKVNLTTVANFPINFSIPISIKQVIERSAASIISGVNYDKYPNEFMLAYHSAGAICGCAFRGANVVFKNDGNCYFSRIGAPLEFIWGQNSDYKVVFDDPANPRTIQVSPRTQDPVLACVAQSVLYAFTRTGGYAFVADFPSDEDAYFRPVPGVRGVVGTKAADAFDGGAIFGSDDGLYYVETPLTRTTFGAGDVLTSRQIAFDELTKGIRPSWKWLIATNGDKVVVRQGPNRSIWAFCEDRFIYRSPSGAWSTGSWATGQVVRDARWDSEWGMVAMLGDGKAVVIHDDFESDGDTGVGGDAGTVPAWEAVGKRFFEFARLRRIRIEADVTGAQTVSFDAIGSDNNSPAVVVNATDTTRNKPVGNLKPSHGTYWQPRLQSSTAGRVNLCVMELTVGGHRRTDS